MFVLQNLIQIIFSKPGTSWLLGNVTQGGALFALVAPFVLGFCLAAWIMHKD